MDTLQCHTVSLSIFLMVLVSPRASLKGMISGEVVQDQCLTLTLHNLWEVSKSLGDPKLSSELSFSMGKPKLLGYPIFHHPFTSHRAQNRSQTATSMASLWGLKRTSTCHDCWLLPWLVIWPTGISPTKQWELSRAGETYLTRGSCQKKCTN